MIVLPTEYVLANARLIDPSQALDDLGWLRVRDGRVADLGVGTKSPGPMPTHDLAGLIICPGLIDIHVHLREPGHSNKETIETGSLAAAAGGFTAVCCMPNTSPPLDTPALVAWVIGQGNNVGVCRVMVAAAATRGRQGREPVNFAELKRAGAVAFTDDGDGIEDAGVARAVLEQVRNCDSVFMPHCEYKTVSHRGSMHPGDTARRLGVTTYDPRGEEDMLARDLDLVAETGARYHVAHISTARGVEMVRRAKVAGLPVTAEASPHHLLLCDQDVEGADGLPNPNRKMSPPLRSREDVAACVAGVIDGTIDCIATDHAPHTAHEKGGDFEAAPTGVIGLETSLACLAGELVSQQGFGWYQLVQRMSTAPAEILRQGGGTLRVDAPADLTVIDPNLHWHIDPEKFRSRSRNTPFAGWPVSCKAVGTVCAGNLSFVDPSSGYVLSRDNSF